MAHGKGGDDLLCYCEMKWAKAEIGETYINIWKGESKMVQIANATRPIDFLDHFSHRNRTFFEVSMARLKGK